MLPQRQRELVATSLIGVEQLTETVHEFLDLTRIEAGELRLNLEPVQVGAAIAESIRRVEAQANAQGIRLVATVASDLPPILADPVRLRAVFDNILSNALKYTPASGTITIETRHERAGGADGSARVSINLTDTGPGIPSGVSQPDLREVLSPRTSSGRGPARRAWRGHRFVYVPADRRVAWWRDLMRCRRSTSPERGSPYRFLCHARTRRRSLPTLRTLFNRPPAPDRVKRIQHAPCGITRVALLLAAVGSTVAAQSQEPLPRFRAGAPLMQVDAYISQDGVPVTDLGLADLEVLEDERPQAVASIKLVQPRSTIASAASSPGTGRRLVRVVLRHSPCQSRECRTGARSDVEVAQLRHGAA